MKGTERGRTAGHSEDSGLDSGWGGKPQEGFAQSWDVARLTFKWGPSGCHAGHML